MIFGYLDPGTGSLILQAVVGGLAGVGVAYKAWRSKLSAKGKGKSAEADAASDQSVEDSSAPAES